MKTKLLFAFAALALASCSNDSLVDGPNPATTASKDKAMSFAVTATNMGRAGLEEGASGKLNFGVWAYKADSEGSFAAANLVMDNFLVGYTNGTDKGYFPSASAKLPDIDHPTSENLYSWWFYDGLGSTQYDYEGAEGFYKASQTAYMSNKDLQYLKYWDYNFDNHYYYAYSPYLKSDTPITFTTDTHVMAFPQITMGTESDYMYAANIVNSDDYGNDVPLTFHRLNAKLNIKVYGEIEGYTLELINQSDDAGILAVGAKVDGTKAWGYDFGEIVTAGKPNVTFANAVGTVSYATGATYEHRDLAFALPTGDLTLPSTRAAALASPTTFYLIPAQPGTLNDGFIFYISYKMTALDNGSVSNIYNAAVFVKPEYTQWKQNCTYTYVFKITDKAGGKGDPTKPSLGEELKPIVFDGMEVADYIKTNNGSEWVPGDATNPVDTPFDAD